MEISPYMFPDGPCIYLDGRHVRSSKSCPHESPSEDETGTPVPEGWTAQQRTWDMTDERVTNVG